MTYTPFNELISSYTYYWDEVAKIKKKYCYEVVEVSLNGEGYNFEECEIHKFGLWTERFTTGYLKRVYYFVNEFDAIMAKMLIS